MAKRKSELNMTEEPVVYPPSTVKQESVIDCLGSTPIYLHPSVSSSAVIPAHSPDRGTSIPDEYEPADPPNRLTPIPVKYEPVDPPDWVNPIPIKHEPVDPRDWATQRTAKHEPTEPQDRVNTIPVKYEPVDPPDQVNPIPVKYEPTDSSDRVTYRYNEDYKEPSVHLIGVEEKEESCDSNMDDCAKPHNLLIISPTEDLKKPGDGRQSTTIEKGRGIPDAPVGSSKCHAEKSEEDKHCTDRTGSPYYRASEYMPVPVALYHNQTTTMGKMTSDEDEALDAGEKQLTLLNPGAQAKENAEEKPHNCSLCDHRYARNGGCVQHLRNHDGKTPIKCSVCGHEFTKKARLVQHMRTHTGEKPYACLLCDYKCALKSSIVGHIGKHNGEKPHKCSRCDRGFARKSHMVKHMETHNARNSGCIQHMRSHDGKVLSVWSRM